MLCDMAFLEKLIWAFWFGSSEIIVNYRFLERTLLEKNKSFVRENFMISDMVLNQAREATQ